MESIQLKFKSSEIHLILGIIWLMLAGTHLFVLLFFIGFSLASILFFISIILSTKFAIHCLTLQKKTYIQVVSDYLFIYSDLTIPFYELRISSINYVEITGNKLFIIPSAGFYKKKLKIFSNLLNKQDYELLIQELIKRGVTVKNLSNSPSV